MKYLHWHRVKQHIAVLLFLVISSASLQAADIQGIAGYTLGETLDKRQVLHETKAVDGATVYTVKPLRLEQPIDIITVRITSKQQIHRISAYSPVLTAGECEDQMVQLRKATENRFPGIGYYAMDQSEMFYNKDRIYTLECVEREGEIRLLQEYSDDKLAGR
jgi:hypothetical protein